MKQGLGGQEWNELVAEVGQPTQMAENFWQRAVRLVCLQNFSGTLPSLTSIEARLDLTHG